MHRRRLCHIVIDVSDLDAGVAFWAAALGAAEEPIDAGSTHIYRRLRLPGNAARLLLQRVPETTQANSPVHLDLETDDVDAEARRLEALGAHRVRLEQERGHRFWVMADPFGNELCVLAPEFPDLLAAEEPVA